MSRSGGASGGSGRSGGGGSLLASGQSPSIETVAKAALFVAGLVFVADLLVSLVDHALTGHGNLDFEGLLKGLIVGYVGDAVLFGSVAAAVVGGATQRFIGWGVLAVYLGGIAQRILQAVLRDFSPDGLSIVINPVYGVLVFLGLVLTYRLIVGETLFPGVDIRL